MSISTRSSGSRAHWYAPGKRSLGRARLVAGAAALSVVGLLSAGCAGPGLEGASTSVLRGTWTCDFFSGAGATESTPWTYTVTDKTIAFTNSDQDLDQTLSYVSSGSGLDLTGDWIQQGYDQAAVVTLPASAPADGQSAPAAISLPNGDVWDMTVTRTGDIFRFQVAAPHEGRWDCRRSG